MGLARLENVLSACHNVLLDTAVFSYHLGRNARYVPLTRAVLRAVESGQLHGLTTTITLTELLTYPALKGDFQAVADYELFLRNFPNLSIVTVDPELARAAALVRAETRLKTPDAIQVAAARLHGADLIATNDRPWDKRIASPRVIILDDYQAE